MRVSKTRVSFDTKRITVAIWYPVTYETYIVRLTGPVFGFYYGKHFAMNTLWLGWISVAIWRKQ